MAPNLAANPEFRDLTGGGKKKEFIKKSKKSGKMTKKAKKNNRKILIIIIKRMNKNRKNIILLIIIKWIRKIKLIMKIIYSIKFNHLTLSSNLFIHGFTFLNHSINS